MAHDRRRKSWRRTTGEGAVMLVLVLVLVLGLVAHAAQLIR